QGMTLRRQMYTAHCKLKISDDGKEVQWIEEGVQNESKEGNRFEREPFVLGTMVRSWRSYWEVCVEEKEDWVLGVALDSVGRKGQLAMSPSKGFWVIRLSNGRSLKALGEKVEVLTDIKPPSKVGIYLDCKEKQVSFYSADGENLSHIYTFTDGPLYEKAPRPIFSPWNNDEKPLRVLSLTHTSCETACPKKAGRETEPSPAAQGIMLKGEGTHPGQDASQSQGTPSGT
uniref:B30.2/SPRY domain-containing protein n=1 Tax=Scleropages formosus TaxID=113540 RepID=A0A8C9RX01_SCLFO